MFCSFCGQIVVNQTWQMTFPTLSSYIAQFRFSQIEVALFCLHELFIRRICQRCWCTIAIFRPLTGSHSTQLLLRMPRRPLLILPYSKNPHDYGCQGVLRCMDNKTNKPLQKSKILFSWTKMRRLGKDKFGMYKELFVQIGKSAVQKSWKWRFW